MEHVCYVTLLLMVNFMKSKYRPSISDENLVFKLRCAINVKCTLDFEDSTKEECKVSY